MIKVSSVRLCCIWKVRFTLRTSNFTRFQGCDLTQLATSNISQGIPLTQFLIFSRHCLTPTSQHEAMNATRFYWAKLQGATNQFQESKTEEMLHKVQNNCCELINEFRCPRLVRIDAYLGAIGNAVCPKPYIRTESNLFGRNYAFSATRTITDSRKRTSISPSSSSPNASRARSQATAIALSRFLPSAGREWRLCYKSVLRGEEEWKAQGKDVLTENEWYEIVEGKLETQTASCWVCETGLRRHSTVLILDATGGRLENNAEPLEVATVSRVTGT